MSDLTAANIIADAAANTVTSGAVRGAVTADPATTAFVGAMTGDPATHVFNLLQTLSAAALKKNGDAADPQVLRTYPAPTFSFNAAGNKFTYTLNVSLEEPAQNFDNIQALSA